MGNTIMPQWICVVHDATQGITNAHECYELSWSVVTYKKIAETIDKYEIYFRCETRID